MRIAPGALNGAVVVDAVGPGRPIDFCIFARHRIILGECTAGV